MKFICGKILIDRNKERRKKSVIKVYFDLDGTVYDLYGLPDWLQKFRNEEPGVFIDGAPLVDLKKLKELCFSLMCSGVRFGVISWLPMGASEEYSRVCELEKKSWIELNLPFVSEVYIQEYGTPKQYAPSKRAKRMFLIDDSLEVRKMWETESQRKGIDAKNIFKFLEHLKERKESF